MASTVKEFLAGLAGKKVFFDPLFGNHGDRLISLSARMLLDQAQVKACTTPANAEFIVVNGGGGMADGWPGQEILLNYSDQYPETPLCVLPSSFLIRNDFPTQLFSARTAPVWLWAREKPSLDHLLACNFNGPIHIGCDHDLAFHFHEHEAFSGLRELQPKGKVLMVERDDWEGPTGRKRPFSVPGLDFIPEHVRDLVRKKLVGPFRKHQDQHSGFRSACQNLLEQQFPHAANWEPICADVSLAESNSFEYFTHIIAASNLIITTRLHVAILGYLLGREVCLVEGSYHKAKGVYDFSMPGDNAHLYRWNNEKQLEPSA